MFEANDNLYEIWKEKAVEADSVEDFVQRYYKPERSTAWEEEMPGYVQLLIESRRDDIVLQGCCIISHHDSVTGRVVAYYPKLRRLSNEEQADLPAEGWENPKVDTRRYDVSFTKGWETTGEMYEHLRASGVLCQVVDGRYIVTNG